MKVTGIVQITSTPYSTTSSTDWWDKAVFYEIFVRSYYDSDGNGIGDFNGISNRLDYLHSLGVNAIWLMPINPSPSYHGYDVTNYYAVNPDYGTMDDFKKLVAEAHKRDIKIIIDLVLNHTSRHHPFFKDANSNKESFYRDWYLWSESKEGSLWHQGDQGYYYGLFSSDMPDLNYQNPHVTMQMDSVVDYWIEDIGIDGFRIDATKHLIEQEGKIENTEATHEWLKEFYKNQKNTHPDIYIIGEVYNGGAFLAKAYEGQLDHIFNFELSSGIINSVKTGSIKPIESAIIFTKKDKPDFKFATFLTNHDQNRIMSEVGGNRNKAKVAASLLLTSPGMPFIYYGEEIGMEGMKPDENIRRPMQWTADENAGFTTGKPWRDPDSKYKFINVEMQQNDPDSLLSHYRNLIQIRNAHPALQTGEFQIVKSKNTDVFASLRSNNDESIIIVVNLSSEPVGNYELSLDESNLKQGDKDIIPLMGASEEVNLTIDQSGGFAEFKPLEEIPPYSSLILFLADGDLNKD
jgi:glycosidase